MKTDFQLKQDVLGELKWEPSVDAEQIEVAVKDGIVTLAGRVASCAEKWNAERAAQRVSGVKALEIEMDVALPGAHKRNDAEITRAAENALQWITSLPSENLKVFVEGGRITLSGQVEWEYQRKIAIQTVHHLIGVTAVSDLIVIKPKVSLIAVKEDIEAALRRRAAADARHISVEVSGTEVRLTGTVHSWPERLLARHAAWGAPGVLSVVDNLSMAWPSDAGAVTTGSSSAAELH